MSGIVACATSLAAVPSLGACVPTPDGAARNTVSYELDGMNVVVEEGLAFAVVDETKHLLGPNTRLYMEAGAQSIIPDEVLGDRLRVNVPVGTSVGRHDVRFTPLPGREAVWVNYRGVETGDWSAYQGSVVLEQLDGIGGRFRASFAELDLVSSCGQRRQLTDGSLDLVVGSDVVFPVSPIDTGDTSEWAELGVSALIENNLMVELDGRLVACPFVDFGPKVIPAAYSGTGRDEEVLEVIAVCDCDHDGAARSTGFGVSAYFPIVGHGDLVVVGPQYLLFVNVDVNGTLEDPEDDEWWAPSVAPRLRYQSVGSELGARVDIELTMPLTLRRDDISEPVEARRLSMMHIYGFVNRWLGQPANAGRAEIAPRFLKRAVTLNR